MYNDGRGGGGGNIIQEPFSLKIGLQPTESE